MLLPNERYDDLEYKGLSVIQSADGYCFTSDSVLLANLAEIKHSDRVVEIGAGCGVISILIASKFSPKKIYALELQERLSDMARRSVEKNELTEIVEVKNMPAQGAEKVLGTDFDVVVTNPPYEEVKEIKEVYSEKDICKTEVSLSTEESVAIAARLLRFGGKFFMVNRARRLADVLCAMRKNGIEPKKLYLIQPKASKAVDTFVVEGKKGAKPALLIPKPIVVYEENGEMTAEAKKIYNK
ncbi:MAG: methyltransferase [Clostridia bacterium]|nr:methyltransferase [Clostridia bacterium]